MQKNVQIKTETPVIRSKESKLNIVWIYAIVQNWIWMSLSKQEFIAEFISNIDFHKNIERWTCRTNLEALDCVSQIQW